MTQHITQEQALKIVRKCVQDACRKEGTYDAITVPHAALLPIFQAASAALAQPASEPVIKAPKANMFHDAGAMAQCGACKRYTLDGNAIGSSDSRQPVCTCGQQHYWSGSFKPPGPDAKWHGPAPTTEQSSVVQAAVSGWKPIESAPKVKRTNKPWDESDRVVVRVEHNRDVYAAFGRYIHSHATGYEWLIEGHGGDWSNRVTGWLPLPAAPTGEQHAK